MTALVIAADGISAGRAADELGLVRWVTSSDLLPVPVSTIVWVKGWGQSRVTAGEIQQFIALSPRALHLQHQLADDPAVDLAARAARRLDHDRAVRAVQRTLATLPPTISPESLAAASTITPERTSWWRRLFRKAAR